MFDSYAIGGSRTEYVPYEKTVHEHRAPTDQSVEILNDMQDKVMKNMIGQLRMSGSTGITDLVASIQYQAWTQETVLFYKFRLNGMNVDGKIPYIYGMADVRDENCVNDMTQKLIEDMGKKIASYYAEMIVKVCIVREGQTVEFDV